MSRLLRTATVVVLASALGGLGLPSAAAAPPGALVREPVLVLLDTSGSMGDDDGTGVVKIEGAKTAVLDLLTALPVDSTIGMRTYPDADNDCGEGTQVFDVQQRAPELMTAAVRGVEARGDTPTAEALRAAALDLDDYESSSIVLVSDGQSTCADPCPVAQALAEKGVQITVNTVGFRIDSDGAAELRCIAAATGGRYVDVEDSDELAERLAALNQAQLDVTLDYPTTFSAVASDALFITAKITNTSDLDAFDVRASIVFDVAASGGSPTVPTPLRTLGNLAAGQAREVVWEVYPSRIRDGQLRFTVTVSRSGSPPGSISGTIDISDELNLDEAGPLFHDVDDVVVLGDSYSSGEGAGNYLDQYGGCHRSNDTYAMQLFGVESVHNLACSGAVVWDHERRQIGRDVASQHDQLDGLPKPDLILLTMGGNDIGFKDVITACLFGDCAAPPRCAVVGIRIVCPESIQQMLDRRLPALQVALETQYYPAVLADAGGTPIVVLPYVNVVPIDDRGYLSCLSGLPLFDRAELELIRKLQTDLNQRIRAAVDNVRSRGNPNLYYASGVETAVLPNHTICDEDSWIRQVNPARAGGTATATRSKQELVHPLTAGYRAIAGALLRWSTTDEARPPDPSVRSDAGSTTQDAPVTAVFDALASLLFGPTVADLDDPPNRLEVDAGSTVHVRASGYEPGSSVVVSVESTSQALASVAADDRGRIDVEVQIPHSLQSGQHALLATGFTPDGGLLILGTRLDSSGPALTPPLIISGLGVLLAAIGLWVTLAGVRTRRTPTAPTVVRPGRSLGRS